MDKATFSLISAITEVEKLLDLGRLKPLKSLEVVTRLSDKKLRDFCDKLRLLGIGDVTTLSPNVELILYAGAGYLVTGADKIVADKAIATKEKHRSNFARFINYVGAERLNCKNLEIESTAAMFRACYNLKSVKMSGQKIDKLDYCFHDCVSLEDVVFEGCDSSNLKSTKFAFSNCINLIDLDLSKLDLSGVTTMEFMFGRCAKLRSVNFGSSEFNGLRVYKDAFYMCPGLNNVVAPQGVMKKLNKALANKMGV